MSMISDALKDTCTPKEVAGWLLDLIAAGIRTSTPDPDPERLARVYHDELRRIPRASIEAVIAELRAGEESFLPTAGKLAIRCRVHSARQQAVTYKGNCLVNTCDCAGPGYYAVSVDGTGPLARLFAEHEARIHSYVAVDQVECPYEGCRCRAVEVYVPLRYARKPHPAAPVPPAPDLSRLSPEVAAAHAKAEAAKVEAKATALQQLADAIATGKSHAVVPRALVWMWECEVEREQVVRHQAAA